MRAKQYFSYNLNVNLNKGVGRATDKKPWFVVYVGMFFSLMMIVLGVADISPIISPEGFMFFDGTKAGANTSVSIFPPLFFSVSIIAIGLFAFVKLFLSLLRYRKIIIKDKKIALTYRTAGGKKRTTVEKIENYLGVLLRVELTQIGIVTKNRYIIELIHKDFKKNVPLYISTSSKNIRKIWIDNAKKLKLPCIYKSVGEYEFKECGDVDKSVIEQVKAKLIKNDYDNYEYMPQNIVFVKKKDKIVLKARKFWFDIFNMFLSIVAFLLCALSILLKLYAFALAVVVISVFWFGKKDKLVIKKQKLVKVNRYWFFNKKITEIYKKDVKSVDVVYSPVTDRYFVAISSDDNLMMFAKKMPLKDLEWVKKFLINEIVR